METKNCPFFNFSFTPLVFCTSTVQQRWLYSYWLVRTFSSPNYPSNYPNSRTCRWIISVPQDHLVQLSFQTFVLETCLISSVCSCDHVEIRDGSDGNSPRLGRFCGVNKPPPTQSTGRFLWVEFDTDLTRNEKGFDATYTAVGMNFL